MSYFSHSKPVDHLDSIFYSRKENTLNSSFSSIQNIQQKTQKTFAKLFSTSDNSANFYSLAESSKAQYPHFITSIQTYLPEINLEMKTEELLQQKNTNEAIEILQKIYNKQEKHLRVLRLAIAKKQINGIALNDFHVQQLEYICNALLVQLVDIDSALMQLHFKK